MAVIASAMAAIASAMAVTALAMVAIASAMAAIALAMAVTALAMAVTALAMAVTALVTAVTALVVLILDNKLHLVRIGAQIALITRVMALGEQHRRPIKAKVILALGTIVAGDRQTNQKIIVEALVAPVMTLFHSKTTLTNVSTRL